MPGARPVIGSQGQSLPIGTWEGEALALHVPIEVLIATDFKYCVAARVTDPPTTRMAGIYFPGRPT